MSTFEVKIDAEAVQRQVSQAILDSTIGEAVRKAVQTEVGRLSSTWNNPLEQVVREEVKRQVTSVLQEPENEAVIREAVRAALEEAVLKDLVGAAMGLLWKEVEGARSR